MIRYDLYILPFSIAFFSSVFLLAGLVALSKKIVFSKRTEMRHVHQGNVSRLGGIALIVSFIAALIIDTNLVITQQLWGVIIALFVIMLVGVWDDFRQLHWKTQLLFQIAIVLFIFILGVHVDYVTNPLGGVLFLNTDKLFLPSLLLVIFWIVLLMNSINWIDGVDGLSGGVTLLGAVTIFLLSLKPEVNQPPVGIVAAALIGSVLAFLIFNFNPARIFAGTSGSMFMGFVLAVLAIFAGAKIATALLVTAIPILDALWVVIQRLRKHRSIFEADNLHLHHKLLGLKWKQTRICWFFYGVTLLIAVAALNTKGIEKVVAISMVCVTMIAFLIIVKYKTERVKNKKLIL